MFKTLLIIIITSTLYSSNIESVVLNHKNCSDYIFKAKDGSVYSVSYEYDGIYRNHFALYVSKDGRVKRILSNEPLNVVLGYVYSRDAKIIKLYPSD